MELSEDHDHEPVKDPLVGVLLARKFKVLSVLGEGGMGRVYKAEQIPLGVEVVIKTLHRHLANDSTIVKRFFREAQAASRLRHPNCISVLDFGDSEGTLYIAMEFLRGRSLAEALEQDGRFEPMRVVRVMSQVLDVLEAAHQMHIVHRDLKPENIMIEDLATRRDFAKVLDFGIAKIVDPLGTGGTKLTQTGMVFGTPAYMAPEQAMGQEIDARADIYTCGVICFELLTMRLPFMEDNAAMLLAAHASQTPPPVLSVRGDIPHGLAEAIDRALAKNPEHRYETAVALKEALEHGLNSTPASGTRSPTPAATRALQPTPGRDPAAGFEAAHPPCPRCGVPVPTSAKFCGECGATTTRHTPSGLKDKFSDLRRFLPSGVVDELSDMGVRGAGEKREIVALIIDVSNTGSLDDPEEAASARHEFYAGLADIALRHTGTLEQRPGGGSIVLFGLTMTHADDAERAVTTALELREYIGELNLKRSGRIEFTAAIHSDSAVVETTNTGPSYTPAGDTVELPTRLASVLNPGKIVVTERVRNLVRGNVQLRKMSAVRLKGRTAAVAAFEVFGSRVVSETPAAQLAQPPFVGREPEADALLKLLDHADAGHVVHVTGEAGSGKSRFLDELVLRISARRHLAISAPARPGPDRISPMAARIVASLGGTVDAMRSLGLGAADIRVLGELIGDGTAQRSFLAEADRRNATVAVLRIALEQLARRSAVVILVDDAHLADPLAADLIGRFVAEPMPRITLVVASRPGYPIPWDAERASTSMLVLKMGPLHDAAVAKIVEGALAPTPAPPELVTVATAHSGGSPLMVLEVLRAMSDQGVLQSIGGRWSVTGNLSTVKKPEGLRALYSGRIDALPAYARDVLACAAVIGQEFPISLLDRIVAQAHGTAIDREIHMLESRGLIAQTPTPGVMRFAEHSARDSVYDRLVKEARSRLHREVGLALTSDQGASAPYEVIAEHLDHGGEDGQALTWYARAAENARLAGQHERLRGVYERSRQVAQRGVSGPDGIDRNRRFAEDSLALGEVLIDLGDLGAIRDVVTEGLAAAHKDDDPDLIARLRRSRGRAYLAQGHVDAALQDLDTALKAAVGLRDREQIANLHGDLGELWEKRGDLQRASEYMMRALELAQGGSSEAVQRAALRLLTGLGRVSLRNRDPERAQRFLQQALTLAEQLDDRLGAAKVLGNLAGVYHARSEFDTAVKFVERALELSRDIGDQVGTARQLNNLGTLHSMTGDRPAAVRNYEAAFEAARRAGWREGMATAAAGRDRLVR